MRKIPTALLVSLALLSTVEPARGQAVAYTDEAAFLADLAALGFAPDFEGFEDDAVWGGVRTTIPDGPHTAPSIHTQGLTWLPNSAACEITTSNGAAHTGNWGFFELPHGDWQNGIRDGFGATGDQPLVAVGGWIRTNTPYAKIALFLDGVPVDLGGNDVLGNLFVGAIDPAGFAHFEYEEQEATPDDWKLIFADHFWFAFGGSIVDCNENGVPDPLDISAGASGDCDFDGVPDECQIHESSTAPGGPFFCTQGCDPDCNANGMLDACEVASPVSYLSGPLSPFGDGAPQSFLVPSPPPTVANVLLDVRAYANLGGPDEFVEVELNGVPLGTLFVNDGDDCPDGQPSEARLVVARDTFNQIVAGGDALVALVASSEVDPDECDSPSWVELELTLFEPSDQDANANGVPDSCEGSTGTVYCVCDGSGTAPPCTNPGGPAAGCANGSFPGGCALTGTGAASVANDTLVLRVADATPGQPGLFFQGDEAIAGGDGVPFGDGLRCAGVHVVRLQVALADGNGQAASSLSISAAAGLAAGDTQRYQWWYRDPALSLCGASFNLSNGLEIVWQL